MGRDETIDVGPVTVGEPVERTLLPVEPPADAPTGPEFTAGYRLGWSHGCAIGVVGPEDRLLLSCAAPMDPEQVAHMRGNLLEIWGPDAARRVLITAGIEATILQAGAPIPAEHARAIPVGTLDIDHDHDDPGPVPFEYPLDDRPLAADFTEWLIGELSSYRADPGQHGGIYSVVQAPEHDDRLRVTLLDGRALDVTVQEVEVSES